MNWNDDNVFFLSDFDDAMEGGLVMPLTREIQRQADKRYGVIDMWVNSFGGYAHLAMHVIELMEVAKAEGITVRTIVPSVAFSAGSMVAIAGTPGERYIARDAEHLIHYGRTGSMEETPKQIERFSAYKTRDFTRTLKLYEKYTDVPDLDVEMMDNGFFVDARKCIKYKLADKYMDKLDIGYSVGNLG
jgi:ATP-dependent protease ClpP protease subunit